MSTATFHDENDSMNWQAFHSFPSFLIWAALYSFLRDIFTPGKSAARQDHLQHRALLYFHRGDQILERHLL